MNHLHTTGTVKDMAFRDFIYRYLLNHPDSSMAQVAIGLALDPDYCAVQLKFMAALGDVTCKTRFSFALLNKVKTYTAVIYEVVDRWNGGTPAASRPGQKDTSNGI